MPLPRITHKRRVVQGFLITLALLLPFIMVSGNPFLRMDIARMTLFLAGIPIRIDQFHLVLLASLLAVVCFLLLTAVMGRVWCGWLCPQTVFNDLVELVTLRFYKKVSPFAAKLIEHITALIIAKLIAFNLVCWFMSPRQAVEALLDFSGHPLLVATFLLLVLFGYLNLVLVKRSFCRSYCPYGRFQAALIDSGTLNLSFLEETRDRCLRCNSCVRNCPMGIDIREGFQIECINCGRCIDACRAVMERIPGGSGLIDYRFGEVKGTRFTIGTTSAVLIGLTLLLSAGLVWGIVGRNQTAFAVQRIANAQPRSLPDGSVAYPWRAIIGNRTDSAQEYDIRVDSSVSAGTAELLGPVRGIKVAANEHREITFMIKVPGKSAVAGKIQLQLVKGNIQAAVVMVSP